MSISSPVVERTRWARRVGLSAAGITMLLLALAFAFVRRRAQAEDEALPVLGALENFSLIDQRGKSVTPADLRGSVWIADFIFTGCQSACPMLTSKMRSLQNHLTERERSVGHPLSIKLISFSVDPEVDTPEKLAAYANKWGADERRWSFLTGSLAEVNRAVTRGLKIPFEKGGADTSAFDVMHGERFVIVDTTGHIRGYFDADAEGLVRIKNAAEALLSEKGI